MNASESPRAVTIGGRTVVFKQRGPRSTSRTVPKATIWKAIREKCLECVGTAMLVKECDGVLMQGDFCNLHPFRFGLATKVTDDANHMEKQFRKPALLRAIRTECIWCLGDERRDICTSPNCQLYPYRMGKAVRPLDALSENKEALCDFSTPETTSGDDKGDIPGSPALSSNDVPGDEFLTTEASRPGA